MKDLYWWRIKAVRGERVRRCAWWLQEFRWPRQRTIRARSRRYRIAKWFLAVTDDRAHTWAFQTPMQRRVRRWLGASRREWELAERESADEAKR